VDYTSFDSNGENGSLKVRRDSRRRADGALERPAADVIDLLLHGARERHDLHRDADQIVLG
jgi:hypothetical protein